MEDNVIPVHPGINHSLLKHVKVCATPGTDPCSHHNRGTTEEVVLNKGTLRKDFPIGPPHSLASVVRRHTKSGLIREEYTRKGLDIPVHVCMTKGPPRLTVPRGQSRGHSRMSGIQAISMQSGPHSLDADMNTSVILETVSQSSR